MTGRVLLAAPRSFCAGVDRAIEIVERLLEQHGAPVYVRHQIVHNENVVRRLEALGAVFVEDEAEIPEGEICVLSAHGVAPSVRDDSGNVDGLPNVVLEALASGAPLVTTGAGGIGDVVEADRTGVIVAERDAAALATAVDALLRDPDRRTRLAREARARVEARYGWPAAAARFEAAYDRALAIASGSR